MPEKYQRELFIGLGGTGGNALKWLYEQMNSEQRSHAKYVFIDTDHRAINKMTTEGIRCIPISNADIVRQVAESLGNNDGVLDWLPNGKTEGQFLSSRLDNGASQCRFKSRLCLARFFKEGARGLRELLEEMTPPGTRTENVSLRIVIVSSIAGGTGAGTFIQTALYIRKFFRRLNQEANITGILACPDLFVNLADDDTERESMYANAYAAIRELNAMNLATNFTEPNEDDKDPENKKPLRTIRGYGSKINVKLSTVSEGQLFDSKDPDFQHDVNAKPFDLIYFVDKANERGGILRDINEYYRIMADVAYTRLYSPMNYEITSGESNEMRSHIHVPTAIYGGAGYARILYPYKEVLKYLAERRLYEELSAEWLEIDDKWASLCERKQDLARENNTHWFPEEGARGMNFTDTLDKELAEENSKFAYLKNMIFDGPASRADLFADQIEEAARSLPAQELKNSADDDKDGDNLPDNFDTLVSNGSKFSVLTDSKVKTVLKDLFDLANPGAIEELSSAKEIYAEIHNKVAQAENRWGEFVAVLEEAAKNLAQELSSTILPLTDTAVATHDKGSSLSLHHALLARDGEDVHPLAARYLLYGLQSQCLSRGASDMKGMRILQEKLLEEVTLALDDDRDDDFDITVDVAEQDTMKRLLWTPNRKADQAADDYGKFCIGLRKALRQALTNADKAVADRTFFELSEPVSELVTLYENFFGSIEDYKQTLSQQINKDLYRHDIGGNQMIYVGASSRVKQYYAVENSVVTALSADPEAVYAATGEGVFAEINERMRDQLKEKKLAARLGEGAPAPQPKSWDMSILFRGILTKYEELLDENATALKTNAVGALVNEICAEMDIKIGEIDDKDHPERRMQFETRFRNRIADLRAKSRPMIRYNTTNKTNYYLEEEENPALNVSKTYCNYGLSPASTKTLLDYFPADERDPFGTFRSKMQLETDSKILDDAAYADNEIFCFSCVHCLQPTQIYHFLEDQDEESYYPAYKARMHSGILSDCPHLDKRWGQHGAMPYISAALELEWRKKVMKALIYESVTGKINGTVDRRGAKWFVREENGAPVFVCWPQGEQIRTHDISRLIEYLAEDEARVEIDVQKLDKMVQSQIRGIYNFAETPQLYKQGMTKDRLLTMLRRDMLTFDQTAKTGAAKTVAGENGEEAIDVNMTLGGVLKIAYDMHNSEERLGEDRDYGEALLAAAEEIVDQYALGLHGKEQAKGSSIQHKEYIEIYNWAIKKFIEDWAKFAAVEKNIKDLPAEEGAKKSSFLSSRMTETEEVVLPSAIAEIPEKLLSTPEYKWIAANWKVKALYKD